MGRLEVLVEGEQFPGHAGPEGVGVSDGLLIELLVFVEIFQMSPGGVFLIESLGNMESVDFVGLHHLDSTKAIQLAGRPKNGRIWT